MPYETITYAVTDRVAQVRLNRPPVNAISLSLYRDLIAAFAQAASDEVSVFVLGSELERIFCAGADLKEWTAHIDDADYDELRERLFFELFQAFSDFPYPIIGACDGAAIGGGYNILSLCDFRVASPSAYFSIPEIDAGRIGGVRFMTRWVPRGIALMMGYTGMKMSATDFYRVGGVEVLATETTAWDTAMAMARDIATKTGSALSDRPTRLAVTRWMVVSKMFGSEDLL
jgi:enoyl-CoA hydratase